MEIGCVVTVTLSSLNRLIGEFNGYKEEAHAIALRNVRFWQEEAQCSSKSYLKCNVIYGELLVECQHILKLEELMQKPSSSSVRNEHNDVTEKSSLPLIRKSPSKMASCSWLPGSKPFRFLYGSNIQQKMQQSMQDYCKMLFENTNFVQLIPSNGIKPDNQIGGIALPKYLASFYREPKIPLCLGCQAETNPTQQHQELVSFQQEFTESSSAMKMLSENVIENNEIFEQNACAMIIAELLNNLVDDEDPIVSVHQLDYEMDKLNLHDTVDTEIAKPQLSDIPHYRLSPFLRYSDGRLHLNETFFNTLCQSIQHNETEQSESLCVEDPNNFVMEWQAIEDGVFK